MPINITVTAPIGPGRSMVAQQFLGMSEVTWKVGAVGQGSEYKVLEIVGQSSDDVHEIDINAITTITHTISGATHTITVS
jgi:hypothetical protein